MPFGGKGIPARACGTSPSRDRRASTEHMGGVRKNAQQRGLARGPPHDRRGQNGGRAVGLASAVEAGKLRPKSRHREIRVVVPETWQNSVRGVSGITAPYAAALFGTGSGPEPFGATRRLTVASLRSQCRAKEAENQRADNTAQSGVPDTGLTRVQCCA